MAKLRHKYKDDPEVFAEEIVQTHLARPEGKSHPEYRGAPNEELDADFSTENMPKNMHPAHDVQRRKRRAVAILEEHGKREGVLFVDATRYPRPAARIGESSNPQSRALREFAITAAAGVNAAYQKAEASPRSLVVPTGILLHRTAGGSTTVDNGSLVWLRDGRKPEQTVVGASVRLVRCSHLNNPRKRWTFLGNRNISCSPEADASRLLWQPSSFADLSLASGVADGAILSWPGQTPEVQTWRLQRQRSHSGSCSWDLARLSLRALEMLLAVKPVRMMFHCAVAVRSVLPGKRAMLWMAQGDDVEAEVSGGDVASPPGANMAGRHFELVRSFGGDESHPTVVNLTQIFRLLSLYTPIKTALRGSVEGAPSAVLVGVQDTLRRTKEDGSLNKAKLRDLIEARMRDLTTGPGDSNQHEDSDHVDFKGEVDDSILYYLSGYALA
ncbi:hypothetical protein HPB49_011484 [Dermacentor silvarum]|uniref:Uncharacterized protein n=1 Tax=Dermacentor silvarum TaxID=543639 RepID=A0ACB8DZ86_DERSI|nr:hypothetical protein HPB49_011484 [Dermacentor silvarum]